MAGAVIKEITSVNAFFEARVNSADPSALQKSCTDSIIQKINSIAHFQTDYGAQINHALKGSRLGEVQTKHVADFVDGKMQNPINKAPSTGKRMVKQFFKCWWNFLKQWERDFILDPSKSFQQKVHIIAEKGIRLDLGYAEEHSKKWALAMLLRCHYDRLPPAKTIYRLLQELKANWESEKKVLDLQLGVARVS